MTITTPFAGLFWCKYCGVEFNHNEFLKDTKPLSYYQWKLHHQNGRCKNV